MRHPERDGILHVNRRHLIQAGLRGRSRGCFRSPLSLEPGDAGALPGRRPRKPAERWSPRRLATRSSTRITASCPPGGPTAPSTTRCMTTAGEDPTQAVPQLAESDEETDTTLTITLRQGVKFHNGREFVAQDVV